MEDVKLEDFLQLAMHAIEDSSQNIEPICERKKKAAKKRKKPTSDDELKGDISTQDLNQFTFSEVDLSNIKVNESSINDESQISDIDFVVHETYNDDEVEDGHGKFEKYNKDKLWKLAKIPHHFLPSFNITKHTDIRKLRDYPLLRTSFPHSVYVSSDQTNKVDLCHKRTLAFSAYMYRIKALQTAYFTAKKKKQVRKEEKTGVYDKTLVDFILCRDNHPDKFFERDYDFYYTGGNLCVNAESGHVLHTSGSDMKTLNLSLFEVDDKPKLQSIGSVDLAETDEDDSEIFEIQFSKTHEDVFFLRRSRSISMIEYKNDTFHALNTLQSSTIPVISFSEGSTNPHQLAITNLQHQFRLYDVENSAVIQKHKVVPKKDITPATNWNMIRSFDRNVYIYAACKRVTLIDTRAPQSEWENNYCGFDEENPCSTFCSLAVSNFDGLFYAGSNHKAYCIDRRNMGKNIDNKNTAVVRWTHQMTSCPLMMAVNQHENNEYVVLQSPQSADLRICENMRFTEISETEEVLPKKMRIDFPTGDQYEAPCLPYMPETLESVFREARKSGACIKPDLGIADRVKACNTGLSFVGPSSSPYILTATSNGDVFARHMFEPDNSEIFANEISAVEAMNEYAASVSKSAPHPRLSVTEVCDFSGINKVFRCAAFSDTKPEDEPVGVSKRKYMGRWQKSYSRLCKFKDALATDLLAIWDIEEPEEKGMNLTDIFQSTSSDRKSLVNNWLNSTQGIKSNTILNMTSIPMDSFNDITTVVNETALNETSKNESNLQELEDALIIAKAKEKSKKKNRYVKGF